MLVSKNILSRFVNIGDIPSQDILQTLSRHTAEVENYETPMSHMRIVVLGRIEKIEPHPKADKVRVTQTITGDKTHQILCGAQNIYEGMYVPVALIGTKLSEDFEIVSRAIRGVESHGMLCSQKELGIGENHEGIWDLSDYKDDYKLGTPLTDILQYNDTIFEIDNKSITNRPDLWGHEHIAREIALLFDTAFAPYEGPSNINDYNEHFVKEHTNAPDVAIKAPELCSRYSMARFDVQNIRPLDTQMQNALLFLDHGQFHPAVDVTNLVMEAIGQPMHAFDADKIEGTVQVRMAKDGEEFVTLNGETYTLSSEDIVIADDKKVIGLAGVMGGQNSMVTKETKTILLESAHFDAVSVRRTAKRHDLRTDASMRFEKTLDPENCIRAQSMAGDMLIKQGATLTSQLADGQTYTYTESIIRLPYNAIVGYLGTAIDPSELTYIFDGLGFDVHHEDDVYMLTIPSYRAFKDIQTKEDVIEEIARIYGYDKLDETPAYLPMQPAFMDTYLRHRYNLTDILATHRYQEVWTYSMIPETLLSNLHIQKERVIPIQNPLSLQFAYMAPNGIPGMADALSSNARQHSNLAFFEFGKFSQPFSHGHLWDDQNNGPNETASLTLGLVQEKSSKDTVYALRDEVMTLLEYLGMPDIDMQAGEANEAYMHPYQSIVLQVQGTYIANVFTLNPVVKNNFDFEEKQSVALASIDIHALNSVLPHQSPYITPSRFQKSPLDFSFLVPKETKAQDVLRVIKDAHEYVVDGELFDVYEGTPLNEDQKSQSFRVYLQSDDKSLDEADIQDAHKKIIAQCEKNGYHLR